MKKCNVYGTVSKSQQSTHSQNSTRYLMITHRQLSSSTQRPMRIRFNCFIDSAADDPYSLEIRYHHKCWLKYVRSYKIMCEYHKLPQMHNVTLRETRTMLFEMLSLRNTSFGHSRPSFKTITLSFLGMAFG